MSAHSAIPAWKTPWTEQPGGLQSTGSQRIRHNRATEHTAQHKAVAINIGNISMHADHPITIMVSQFLNQLPYNISIFTYSHLRSHHYQLLYTPDMHIISIFCQP